MRTIWWRGLAGFAVLATAAVTIAQAGDRRPPAPARVYATGAVPIDSAAYAALPKLPQFRAFLPRQVDLSARFPAPGYQGQQPNCVAWATVYAAHTFLTSERAGRQPTGPGEQMSPAYVYNRLRPPGSPCDRGIRIVDALNLLQREGAVSFADFPDDTATCTIPAPAMLLDKAADHRLADWRAVARERPGDPASPVVLDDVKGALARGEGVVFAMPALDDFFALRGDAVYRHDGPAEGRWHAMAIVGYDEDRQALRVMNSWGADWGDHGYAWVDYATFRALAGEAYALQPLAATGPARPIPAPVDPRRAFEAELARTGCAGVRSSQAGDRLRLSGFGGDAAALERLHQAALRVDPGVEWAVAHHPWPQCEAELTLATALKAGGVTLAATTGDGDARGGDPIAMKAGEMFGFTASVPADKPHLSIVYLQADGSAVELYRGTPADRRVAIGVAGKREARFRVGAPFGDELIIAIASDRPLLGATFADYATERRFLTALRAALAPSSGNGVAAATLRLRTTG